MTRTSIALLRTSFERARVHKIFNYETSDKKTTSDEALWSCSHLIYRCALLGELPDQPLGFVNSIVLISIYVECYRVRHHCSILAGPA